MPTTGLAYTKKALLSSFTNTLDDQLRLEDQFQQLASETHDYKEGVQSFIEKRKPVFNGK
jgi:2-(1,2-epoxy-1,2-dihydrophenyl)acetyl-CoA isomerase